MISQNCGHEWSVSLQVDVDCTKEAPKTNSRIGLDLGLKTFATDSNGKKYKPLKILGRFLKKLKHKSRKLSKKIKFSKNRRKARKKRGKLHRRIADKRQDYFYHTRKPSNSAGRPACAWHDGQ